MSASHSITSKIDVVKSKEEYLSVLFILIQIQLIIYSFFVFQFYKEKSDYKVHILPQRTNEPTRQSTETASTPSTSRAGSEAAEEKPMKAEPSTPTPATFSTPSPAVASPGTYSCHSCPFTTTRLNVLILHNKTHSVSFMPYTPSPVRKKPTPKPTTKPSPKTPKTPKTPKARKEKTDKAAKKSSQAQKRSAEEKPDKSEWKKPKTEQEIKSSLLADWEDADEESNDESSTMNMAGSPEVPVGPASPAAPTPAELPSAPVPGDIPSPVDKKSDELCPAEKPESSSDSKYEFCEDEDWPVEAGVGRKIPRVKNPSKRKEETKSLSIDEDEVAKEVAELLNKTAVPELPSVPEPLKVEENFPEPSIVKSPDKKRDNSCEPSVSSEKTPETKPTKAIFKTKTFFRSRHSRSQDAIGKYVAEQLNAAERMDLSESELNGSEAVSSPEARESPPVEQVKVARLAPKIQLKKMKAEAAQLREKVKSSDYLDDEFTFKATASSISEKVKVNELTKETENTGELIVTKSLQDVLYPTPEIKPINKAVQDKLLHKEDKRAFFGIESFYNNDKMDRVRDMIDNDHNKAATIDTIELLQKIPDERQKKLLDSSSDSVSTTSPLKLPADNARAATPIEEYIKETALQVAAPIEENIMETAVQVEEMLLPVEKADETNNQANEPLDKIPLPIEEIPKVDTQNASISDKQNAETLTLNESLQKPKELSYANQKENDTIQPKDISSPINLPQPSPQKSSEQTIEPYMNESTASAVDALLSVSRETDRVPRIISNDLPEDLFEDDHKDGTMNSFANENIGNGICEESNVKDNETATEEIPQNLNCVTEENVLSQEVEMIVAPSEETVKDNTETVIDNIPSESDLQIAEALINLPSTAIQSKTTIEHPDNVVPMCVDTEQIEEEIIPASETVIEDDKTYETKEETISTEIALESLLKTNNKNLNARYETELEENENLNAAQSLVQMSESIDHKISVETKPLKSKDLPSTDAFIKKQNNGLDVSSSVEQKVALLSSENSSDAAHGRSPKFETTSSKLLKILEDPCPQKTPVIKTSPMKQVIIPGKEKILNFDVAKSSIKPKPQAPKQKIIIRRTGSNKSYINNLTEVVQSPDKIILSRSSQPSQDGSSVQTFTIQAPAEPHSQSDAKQIIIQPKIRKLAKAPTKLQKIKPQSSLITQLTETKILNQPSTEESIFDISSMPVVLSDEILTPESIEKMPVVMSDGIISNTPNPPKLVKTKPTIIENEKVPINPVHQPSKPEVKTLLMNTGSDVTKVTTPNILSKSSKMRGAKPMLVIDKATGKQKIIMTKAEPTVKEIKPTPTLIQSVPQNTTKAEKFIILPTASSPRTTRTQKIVIDPQTGKAHVLVAKGQEPQLGVPENKPVSAKLIPSSSDASTPGNTVMIITNAQGAQSRIVLTPEHEKILFPNKQQPNVSQLKTITHRISTNTGVVQKTVVTTSAPVKTQTRIVPKQKSAIITSKGQLIVGGRVASTSQNIAPMPEIRPAPKRILASEPKKLVQAIQKNSSEPLIFLQQKSGAVMQLTAAQFEHLQRTGQIIQKTGPVPENKIVVQKSITISPKETIVPTIQKQRVRKAATESTTPAKKLKSEIAIAPAPAPTPSVPLPPLTSLSNTVPTATVSISPIVPTVSNTISVSTTPSYSDLDNFEELLPSTAIVRQPEPAQRAPPPEPAPAPAPQPEEAPPAQLSDGQLLAVPCENFGGPPGSFYLCVGDNGTLTPIDNRPLVLENNQLVPMPEPLPVFPPQPERRDILEAALANSDVFHADTTRDEVPDFRDLNANVSVHCRVSETSTTLNQPIMTPVEVPSKGDHEPAVPANLEDGLAVIGVTPHMVPTSLELPITVTDPRIALKTTDPLSNSNYGTSLLPSPNTELTYVTTEETVVGPISMPLLTDEESVGGGKSMPILTDEVAERTVSSVESTVGSPSSLDVRESEPEDGGQWTRRLLTPCSDTSEASAEIPLQPSIQLSVNDLSRH